MKRLLMLLTTFCLLLMTTALAETEAEWNAKCEWKTGTGTTLYAVTQGTATSSDLSDFVPVGTLPANTYVGILERSGNMRNVRYWNGSGTSSGWVNSAALVWVGSNSSKPKPSGSRATASDLSRKPDDTWNSLTVTYSDGDEAQTVSLQTLGVAMSEIYMDGEFLRVPTASLSWETEADDNLFIEIKKEIEKLGIDKKIVPYKVLTIPKVDLKKYMEVINNNVSIFANNCWGGLVYHRLGLQFRSPLINMFFHDEDYLKFLNNPQKYINTKLSLKKECFVEETQKSYPICKCDDILLYFNHSESFEEANNTWEKRKKRINWDNIFVMMYTENKDVALDFSKLPYSKKVCFVPFQTDIESLFSLDFYEKDELSKLEFWQIVNGSISGMFECYDLVELLCSGKILRTAE